MNVENEVHPAGESIGTFLSGAAAPVVMVNLLRFRERAEYADGRSSTLSGREAYELYANEMRKLVEADGGRFLFIGEVESLLLGKVDELWDTVALVEYAEPSSLVRIASSPDFAAIETHRVAGLAGQLNLAVRQQQVSV